MIEVIKDRVSEAIYQSIVGAARDWLASGGGITVILAILSILTIWSGITLVARKFLTPILMTGIAFAFASVYFFPQRFEKKEVIVEKVEHVPDKIIPGLKVEKSDVSGLLDALHSLRDVFKRREPTVEELAEQEAKRLLAMDMAKAKAEEARAKLEADAEKRAQAKAKKPSRGSSAAELRARNAYYAAMIDDYLARGIAQGQAYEAWRNEMMRRQWEHNMGR